jgi:hypothetical protein
MTAQLEELEKQVEKYEQSFINELNEHFSCSMKGGRWVHFHNDMMEVYGKGIKLCQEFYETKDRVKLIKNLLDSGFDGPAFSLKKFILDKPEAVALIEKLEESWLEVDELLSCEIEEE